MKSIYGSKLYKASGRKDRIHAALLAPGNLSLVQQLAESLDDEYQTPENLGTAPQRDETKTDSQSNEELIIDEEIDPETDLMTMDDLDVSEKEARKPSAPKPSKRSSRPEPIRPKEPTEPAASEEALKPEAPAEAEASTKIETCTEIDITTLRDSLNSRGDTAGATRVAEKENEVWIYYKDDVNLNNIMTDVIEYISNAGFVNLEFNRLARSDNAIVFVVTKQTAPIGVQEVTAAINIGKTDSNYDAVNAPEVAEAACKTAVTKIKEMFRKPEFEDSDIVIKDVTSENGAIKITFKNNSHAPLVISSKDVQSGDYMQIVADAMFPDDNFKSTNKPFGEVLKEKQLAQ